MKTWVLLTVLGFGFNAFGLSEGARVRVLKDTQLMSGTKALAPIKKGDELDVLKLSPEKSWFLTTVEGTDGKPLQGWCGVNAAKAITGKCATGFQWECSEKTEQVCYNVCTPSCTTTQDWVCNYVSVTGPTGESTTEMVCGYVPSTSCTEVCHQECEIQTHKTRGCLAP